MPPSAESDFDLAVVTQDPRFGGGALAQTEAFIGAARALGRRPHAFYGVQPGLAGRSSCLSIGTTAARTVARGVESANQLVAAQRLSPLLRGHDVWVVAATATHGLAALRSGEPYACWVGTPLDAETTGRRAGLPTTSRLAAAVNAPFLTRIERAVLRGARRVFATGAWSRAALANVAGLALTDVGILPIPVDVDRLRPGLGRPREPATLVLVGRLDDPRKNIALALETFLRVRAAIPEARLLLVGEGSPPPLPPGAEALGYVDDLATVLHRASVLVLPSRQEGFGIVVAEALAAGLAVVSTPCGGPEALLRESGGGTVVGSFDSADMAQAILDLLHDPARRARIADAGRAYVEREHHPGRLQELLAKELGR